MTRELIADDAKRLDQRIRLVAGSIGDSLAKLHALVEEAKRGEVHKALGFPSWTAYLADALTIRVQIDREQRRELVGYLNGEGMSQRAIATVVGASVGTVNSDLDQVFSSEHVEPAGDPDDSGEPEETTGIDNKVYPRRRPEPKPPRRRPITDEFLDLSVKLRPIEKRFRKLIDDDRIARNREALTSRRNDLIRFGLLVDDLIAALSESAEVTP